MPSRFAQFFTMSTGYVQGSIPPRFDALNAKPIEACGSDSVLYFDGRWSVSHCISEAKTECVRRGYVGFQIMRHNPYFGPDFRVSEYFAV